MSCEHPQLFIQHWQVERVEPCMYCERNEFLDALRDARTSFEAVAVHSVQPAMRQDAKEQLQLIDALLAKFPGGMRAMQPESET
jgi:hypothetical protein